MSEKIFIKKNEFLIHEGEESSTMYFLHSGVLDVYKRRGDSEVKIGQIMSGEVVGEMSFLDKLPRSASVKAASDSELSVIEVHKFDSELNKLPVWYKALVNTLLTRLRKANARIKI